MCYKIPAVLLNNKMVPEGSPIWLEATDVLYTNTVRIKSTTHIIYVTARGHYRHVMDVGHMMMLINELDAFVNSDRGSLFNMDYTEEIDQKLKVAILKDNNGERHRVTIGASKLECVKEVFKRYCRRSNE